MSFLPHSREHNFALNSYTECYYRNDKYQLYYLQIHVKHRQKIEPIILQTRDKHTLHYIIESFDFLRGFSPFSCLIYVICVCLLIVVYNTYCVVFLFCLLSSCVPYVDSFSRLFIYRLPLRYFLMFMLLILYTNKFLQNKQLKSIYSQYA